jgi:hypothetical protein
MGEIEAAFRSDDWFGRILFCILFVCLREVVGIAAGK